MGLPPGTRFAAAIPVALRSFSAALRLLCACLFVLAASARSAWPQNAVTPAAGPAQAAPAPPPRDPLGRDTPRGTVLGFLSAARKSDHRVARHYLNTRLGDEAAENLSQQLFVVLDARMPAQVLKLSDVREGSRSTPCCRTRNGSPRSPEPTARLDIIVERVRPAGNAEPVWLFSPKTLAGIPATFAVISNEGLPSFVPGFLVRRQFAGIRLVEWLLILLGLPIVYLVTGLVNRAISPLVAWTGQRLFHGDGVVRNALPAPARLLILSIAAHVWVASLPVSLLVRVLITNAAGLTEIVAVTWLLVLLAHQIARYTERRLAPANFSATVSLLRVGRTLTDVVIVIGGVLAMLRHFGVDPTPVLAGLGVGGLAVALAAQKTLENVIAGASLIFDQAVRVGDFLQMGTSKARSNTSACARRASGRSDRTIVSVPNSQIANMSLETLSARDKFWFHPIVGLRYDTDADNCGWSSTASGPC